MNTRITDHGGSGDVRHFLRFDPLYPLYRPAREFACDAEGHVNMDGMSDQQLRSYLYARATIGRDFATPRVIQDFDDIPF